MRSMRILPLLLVIAAVGIAACGGDDDDDQAAAPPETATEEEPGGGGGGGGLTVGMTEFEFEPNDLSVEQGETVTADNTGSVVHNFTIEEGPDASEPSKELAATPDLNAGDSDELTVDLEPGEYGLVCTIGNHRELGMIGTIEVK